ncbi:MAG: hypothetical protein JJ855_14485 [Rhodospirillales bacterium]|nr:hypothetical protein [Rhodospirillales bacterium]
MLAGFAAALPATPAHAHHGWRWAEDGNFEITGSIVLARLGNPHGLVRIDVNGEHWTIEVGQPWRNDRAGLTDKHFAKGNEITVSGHRSKDPDERLVKAERLIIGGKTYDLYPERD